MKETFPKVVGGVPLESPLILAPMAGITIPPMRAFFRKLGAAAVHTEMISGAGLIRSSVKTKNMLAVCEKEDPVILQFFAGDTDTLYAAACKAEQEAHGRFAAVGINMACPMPKVLKKGAGSRLLQYPDRAVSMVRALKEFNLPVWGKVRICSDRAPLSTEMFCEKLLEAGADNICVHGRTPAQRYSGTADKESVMKLAQLFPGKISASGDVFEPEDALQYLNAGCVSVFMARGALKDPFIFPQTLATLGFSVDNRLLCPSIELQISLLIELGDHIAEMASPRLAEILIKRLLSGMFKGIPGIAELRRDCASFHGWDELRRLMSGCEHYFERRDVLCRPM
ncbi:MAG: tRNA-dihydrouridine synthase family protein [Aminobacterium sp.]|jgi:tRNA-dihydrouridine synthase|nr:tRNA-dihydrouridine synthase family protein [Aminobacterium sp.]